MYYIVRHYREDGSQGDTFFKSQVAATFHAVTLATEGGFVLVGRSYVVDSPEYDWNAYAYSRRIVACMEACPGEC